MWVGELVRVCVHVGVCMWVGARVCTCWCVHVGWCACLVCLSGCSCIGARVMSLFLHTCMCVVRVLKFTATPHCQL